MVWMMCECGHREGHLYLGPSRRQLDSLDAAVHGFQEHARALPVGIGLVPTCHGCFTQSEVRNM